MLVQTEPNVLEQQAHRRRMRLMGNQFEITVVSGDSDYAGHCIDEAVNEISRGQRQFQLKHSSIKPY